MKLLKKLIFIINILLVVGLGMAYLSPYFDPNKFWLFSIFGLFYPVLLLANLAMVIFWMFVEFKYLFLSLIVILLGWFHLRGFVNFSAPKNNSTDLKVMTYNLGFSWSSRSGNAAEKQMKKEEVMTFFERHEDVDIFCLQESSYFSRSILKKVYKDYFIHEVDKRGTFIFSKYPIIRHGEISFGTKTNSCLWADVGLKNDTVRIYNMHLQSNRVSKDAVEVIDNVNLQEKETWDGILGILTKYSSTSKIRARQAEKVAEHASKSLHPTIICGDGNDPPTSFTYSTLKKGYQDSFIESGSGIGTTYAGKIPMLRIDFIFVDEQFEVNTFQILKEDYSDHYAVKASYQIKK